MFKWQDIARKSAAARAQKPKQQKKGSSGKRIAGIVMIILGFVVAIVIHFYTQYLQEQAILGLGLFAFLAAPQIALIQLGGLAVGFIFMILGGVMIAIS